MAPSTFLVTALSTFAAIGSVVAVPATTAATTAAASTSIATENGPYANPYDATSQPVTWPGLPTSSDADPPARPTSIFPYGGKKASDFKSPAWIPKKETFNLAAALSQAKSNGKSKWGTPDLPPLPFCLPGKYQYNTVEKRPTKTMSSGQTPTSGPCGTAPNTGQTRTYNLEVSYATIAPDGVTKNGLVVNGGFPGPLIEANWGDMIKINVKNNLPDEGTSLHWHGFLQNETPWFDGVPAVSQVS
jgi:FtsP/CotA-like multicopper oxidase with cupredoxin domain